MLAFKLVLALLGGSDVREEKGATAVEYALVVGLVSIVVVTAVALFGPAITTFVNGVKFS